jgi:hypothetical protein
MGLSIKISAITVYRMQTRGLYESLIICILGIKLDNHGFKVLPSCPKGLSLFLHHFHLVSRGLTASNYQNRILTTKATPPQSSNTAHS